MVAAALTGLIGLVTAKLMKDQADNQTLLRARAEINKATSLIESALRNRDHCRNMLNTLTPGSSVPSLAYRNLRTNDLVTLIRAPADYGLFKLEAGDIRLSTSSVGTGMMDVVITYRIKPNYRPLVKKIPVLVTLDGTAVKECGAFLADANKAAEREFCESLGATVATWIGNNCVLQDMTCPLGQVVDRMTSLGGIICVNVEDRLDIPSLFDTTPKNCVGLPNYSLGTSGGRIIINCTN